MTIDEKLETFRGRCSFRQCFPSKSAKYGIKIFTSVNSRTFYTWNLEIYAWIQPKSLYKAENVPDKIVNRLIETFYNSRCNLTVSKWYASYGLAKDLPQKKITLFGTMKKNKREQLEELVSGKKREIYSSLFGFQKNMTLVSNVPKRNKRVILLFTMHNNGAINVSTAEAKNSTKR